MPLFGRLFVLNSSFNLNGLGWNQNLEKEFHPYKNEYEAGRVAVEYKGMYTVYCEKGEVYATVSGRMMHDAEAREDYPAVGDWVIIDPINTSADRTIIRGILKRKSKFTRKYAGPSTDGQIIAVNVDILFICMALNENYNLRRLERYLIMAWDSGATPVVLLTKSDLCSDVEEKIQQTELAAAGVDVHYSSCVNKTGLESIKKYIVPGRTIAFLGSSGVGKSSIINELTGDKIQEVREVSRIEGKGRHTTTNRELILLPDGGIVIDTPGMREFHLMDAEESVDSAFKDIESIGKSCRFSDCTHRTEPGCAVREAVESGVIDEKRLENYDKLRKEAEFMEKKASQKAARANKRNGKKSSRNSHIALED